MPEEKVVSEVCFNKINFLTNLVRNYWSKITVHLPQTSPEANKWFAFSGTLGTI